MNARRFGLKASALVLAAGLALSGCTPVISQRGYIPDQTKLDSISPGVDTKQTVVERLGTPSTIGDFDASVWYYVASEEHQNSWRRPQVVNRTVIAIEFDENSQVSDVTNLSIKDARIIRPVARKTPTKGRELTFWEQMFGNIGRLPTGGEGRENPGR